MAAHAIRVERGDYAIGEVHLADAIERLVQRTRPSLSADRLPQDPYPGPEGRGGGGGSGA